MTLGLEQDPEQVQRTQTIKEKWINSTTIKLRPSVFQKTSMRQ